MKLRTLFSALLLAASQAALAGTINFDDLSLTDYDDIPVNYADHGLAGNGDSRVGVTYSGSNGALNHLDFWNLSYGDLSKVAFTPDDGTTARITLKADTGWLITSIAFDLAGWPDTDLLADVMFGISGESTVTLTGAAIQGDFTGPRHNTFSLTHTGDGGNLAFIEWGTDWNVGIDNIVFTVARDPDAPPPLPEPGSLALLGISLAALAVRRKVKH